MNNNNINKLTAKNVENIFINCYSSGFNKDSIAGKGTLSQYFFNRKKINAVKNIIVSFLKQLPDEFQQSKGGGWSFLNACVDKEGNQWGEHKNIEQLIALGNALDLITFPIPKEIWNILPGGAPYFVVKDEWSK